MPQPQRRSLDHQLRTLKRRPRRQNGHPHHPRLSPLLPGGPASVPAAGAHFGQVALRRHSDPFALTASPPPSSSEAHASSADSPSASPPSAGPDPQSATSPSTARSRSPGSPPIG